MIGGYVMDEVEKKKEVMDRLSDEIYDIGEEIWLLLMKLDLIVSDVRRKIRSGGFSLWSRYKKEIEQQLDRFEWFYKRQLNNGEVGRNFWVAVDRIFEKKLRKW
jgi:hypothetical protein